jgi:hypothetical protein
MQLEEITLALFAACNSFRVIAYANPKGGQRQERDIIHLLHDLVPVLACPPIYSRLRARQSLRLGVGGLLRHQRLLLRCYSRGRVLEAAESR